jgi:3-hydroxybutyryl-CoA dehydratase
MSEPDAKPDVVQLYFEDFAVGQTFPGATRTITQDDVIAFSNLTGDKHPIHYDAEYASKAHFGRPVVHGLHLMSLTAVGATRLSSQLTESMIAFIDQGCRFLKPVFVGEAVTSHFEVIELLHESGKQWGAVRLKCQLRDPTGAIILDGSHLYRLRCRTAPGGVG